jgi:sugar lactone lactonase YvrE
MSEQSILVTGLALGESPRWHDDRLWFCDWGAHEVIAADLTGRTEIIAHVPSFPFSIDWSPDGRLLVVSGSDCRLLQRDPDGTLVQHADLTSMSDRPWNEIVVDGRGNAYVNSIGFDLLAGEEAASGILALVTPDGSTRQVADGLAFPNGMVVTPDGSTLILAESYGGRLTAFDIGVDGDLSNRRVWADVDGGAPDGICLDADGAVWYADVPNKCCVRVREGGEVLHRVDVDRGCFACALGGTGGRTLFIMAAEWHGPARTGDETRSGQVVTVEAPVPGVDADLSGQSPPGALA